MTVTRKSYPPLALGPVVTCPCCKRELEVSGYIDGETAYLDEHDLHVTLVPLRMQRCFQTPGFGWAGIPCEPFRRGYRPGGACNWLGEQCNDVSHVTPCYAQFVTTCDAFCVCTSSPRSRGLARCVHKNSA